MAEIEHRITSAQTSKLLDAAFRSPQPAAYLGIAAVTFRVIGRYDDAATATLLQHLHTEGEIEQLMILQAAWKRGLARDPMTVIG